MVRAGHTKMRMFLLLILTVLPLLAEDPKPIPQINEAKREELKNAMCPNAKFALDPKGEPSCVAKESPVQ